MEWGSGMALITTMIDFWFTVGEAQMAFGRTVALRAHGLLRKHGTLARAWVASQAWDAGACMGCFASADTLTRAQFASQAQIR